MNARRLYRRFLRMPVFVAGRWYARVVFRPSVLDAAAWHELARRLDELDMMTKYTHLEEGLLGADLGYIAIAIKHLGPGTGDCRPRSRAEQSGSRIPVNALARLVAFLRRRGARPRLTLDP